MADVNTLNAYYHIVDEGLENDDSNTDHMTISGSPRTISSGTAHVSGPLSPGIWEISFNLTTTTASLSNAIHMAHGATSLEATPTVEASALAPLNLERIGAGTAFSTPSVITMKVLIPKALPYIGFIPAAATTYLYSVRLLHGI